MDLVFKGFRFLGLALALAGISATSALSAPEAATEEADVVSLDTERPAETATAVATSAATPAPTTLPSPVAAVTSLPSPEPRVTGTPLTPVKEDLSEPGFDKSKLAKAEDEGDGIVIIAPGAASPEDSFEAFGIDSPFNWKERKKRAISAPAELDADGAGESIELNAPETSDFKDQVEVEVQGKAGLAAEDYDLVERSGFILPADEFRFDARVIREKNGRLIFGKGDLVNLQLEPGRQIYPGSVYTCFRDEGKVVGPIEKEELGQLLHAVSVVRIVRVDSEFILARVERQYDSGKVGDILRLRDPDRARHFASLRQNAGEAPSAELRGAIAEVEHRSLSAKIGKCVYLNIGRSQGVLSGMKLMVYRDLGAEREPTRVLPGPVGKIGELQVISTQKNTCTARLVKAGTGLRVGDKVRYR